MIRDVSAPLDMTSLSFQCRASRHGWHHSHWPVYGAR